MEQLWTSSYESHFENAELEKSSNGQFQFVLKVHRLWENEKPQWKGRMSRLRFGGTASELWLCWWRAGLLSIPPIKLLFSAIESSISWVINMNFVVAKCKTDLGIYEVFTKIL